MIEFPSKAIEQVEQAVELEIKAFIHSGGGYGNEGSRQ